MEGANQAPVREGDVLAGKYRVDRVLGIGGMGVVVAATHLQLDQKVALKFMLPDAFANAEAMGRFQREAKAAVKLRSEHVARVQDVGTLETGSPYIVMEYLSGGDLADQIEKRGPLPVADIAEYIIQACDALAEAHSLGIIHRDLKPANLFLTTRPDGSPLVKVLDFGISKVTAFGEAGLGMTKTASMMGSPLYMSPEQMRSAKDVDPRTDVWSLGVIIYELAGGRVPFNADTLGELMARVLTQPPPPLSSVRSDLPPQFLAIVDRCIEKDLSLRCKSVSELARALAPFAPSRTQPIVERISGVLKDAPPVSVQVPAFGVITNSNANGQSASPMAGTAPGWDVAAPNARRSHTGLIAGVVIGVVCVAGICAGAFIKLRAPKAAAHVDAIQTPVTSTPTQIASAPIQTQPTMTNPTSVASITPAAPSAVTATNVTRPHAASTTSTTQTQPTATATTVATATATATATRKPGVLDDSF